MKCPNQYRAYGFFKDDAAQAVVDAIKARRPEVQLRVAYATQVFHQVQIETSLWSSQNTYLSHGTCEFDMADFDMAHMKSDGAPRTWGKGLELVDAKKVLRIPIWNKKTTQQLVLGTDKSDAKQALDQSKAENNLTSVQIFNMSDRSLNRKSPDFPQCGAPQL